VRRFVESELGRFASGLLRRRPSGPFGLLPAVDMLRSSWPALIVLAFAAWLLWPVWAMPMSADHTVHLTRIVLTANRLVDHGALSGWEPTWFFGFPLGELYPQLGDLLVLAIRALSLGLLEWPSAYALGFYLVFAIQGLVLVRVGRLFGLGPWPGLIAALLMLGDAGGYREGGWMYTVQFGVWPQPLATSLVWLGLGEMARALGWRPTEVVAPDEDTGVRRTAIAGLCFGAALLAHPMALPSLGIGGLLMLITLVPRASVPWRVGVVRCVIAGLLGVLLAAWWLVPMMQHKAWMASYGWLYAPLEVMLRWLTEDGRWAQNMPAAVGFTALVGIALASVGVGRVARFVALFTVVQWLLASNEAFWQLRLDRFSEGFTHIQYQRFLIGAKPGLFLCAGLAISAPIMWARKLWLAREQIAHRWRAIAGALALAPVGAGLSLWVLDDSSTAMTEHEVGTVQIERVPGQPEFEAHYQEFLSWARAQWDAREHDYRIAVETSRNNHLFMDAPIWTATPQYKLGFTPGDNFVHKPESGRREVLDALGVRWLVGYDRHDRQRPGEVARFGPIFVREHRGESKSLAWLDGDGTIEIVEADLRAGVVRARVQGVTQGARVTFAIAGYPRWKLFVDGEPLEWYEEPVWGRGMPATITTREHGDLRGGKARGDNGSEPTLIAAELPFGTGDAEVELRYQQRGKFEALVELASVFAWIGVGLLLLGRSRARRLFVGVETRLVAAAHPLVFFVMVPALFGLGVARWQISAEREGPQLLGWIEAGAASVENVELGPVKADMLIRPAVLLRPQPRRPAVIELEVETLPEVLRLWVALDDDQAQQGGSWARHDLRIEAVPSDARGADIQWSTLVRVNVAHEPGRVMLAVDTGILAGRAVKLRIVDETRGKRVPRLGLSLDLGVRP
jgi:hypothetical protein